MVSFFILYNIDSGKLDIIMFVDCSIYNDDIIKLACCIKSIY